MTLCGFKISEIKRALGGGNAIARSVKLWVRIYGYFVNTGVRLTKFGVLNSQQTSADVHALDRSLSDVDMMPPGYGLGSRSMPHRWHVSLFLLNPRQIMEPQKV